MDSDNHAGQRLLLAFNGKDQPSREIIEAIHAYHPSGITLFRSLNIDSPEQVRHLLEQLQQVAREAGIPPLLICIDQEGGQLMAAGFGTPLPGNMALGATRDASLAYAAGRLIGREMAALGINVVYAPCVDVNINPKNPVVGTRSFGDDPMLVSEMGASLIKGIQSIGIAATAKHFPGHGDTTADSHHGLSYLPHPMERLHAVELPPFEAAIDAGVQMIMTAHLGIVAIDGPDAPPATLSSNIVSRLLRRDLGFGGVVVTDAMDMHAIQQGDRLGAEVVKAARAGVDLILITGNLLDQERAFTGLQKAINDGVLTDENLDASLKRISRLKEWLHASRQQVPLTAIRSREHQDIARQIAEGSITLVRNTAGLLPLGISPDHKIAVIVPIPQDLTPADTSSYEHPALAAAVRENHALTDEIVITMSPSEEDTRRVLESIKPYDTVIVGTINACAAPSQEDFVRRLFQAHRKVVLAAMRLPYDAVLFDRAETVVCTYSILEPSMKAAAAALFGNIPFRGTLPVKLL